MDFAELSLFAHVVARPESQLDLAQAALLIAEPEYPGLEVSRYIEELDRLGTGAKRRIASAPHRPPLDTVVRYLYEELGFHGNTEDYYDPRNSFLNEVLDRRTGIPISLGLVLLETCRRVGIDARGVSFPGHFLVRIRHDDGDVMFLDPFDGRLLDELNLAELYVRATGSTDPIDSRLLEPASKGQVLVRMLNNLRAIYERRGDRQRLLDVLARMQVLAPNDDVGSRIREISAGTPSRTDGMLN
jgi:regulator of sirC expression with transglutaminase-like and TPR domain